MCCLRCFLRCFRLWHGSTSSRCSHGAPLAPPFSSAPLFFLIFAVIVASLWLGALPNLGSQYLQFFGVFFSLLPMRLYDGTPGAGARVKWRFYLIYPAQFILIPLLGMRLAP